MPDNILIPEEQLRLLKSLIELTKSGQVEWQRSDNPLFADRRNLRSGAFRFSVESTDHDGEPPYGLTVLVDTESGRIEMANIVMTPTDEGGTPEVNSMLRELYELAHRRQPREEEMVRGLFEQLNQIRKNLG
jgi:hypothetical protein